MSLPFIPQYLQDPSKGRQKSTLIYRNGYAIPRPPSTTTSLMASGSPGGEAQLTWDPELTYTVTKRAGSPVDKAKATQVEHESLAFEAYSVEQVQYSAAETSRVRRVTIVYFVRDSTLQINERREPNSGLPQGIVLKRQKVPRQLLQPMPGGVGDDVLKARDFVVGSDVSIFGRTYHFYDADFFTRTYFREKEHVDLAPPEPVPDDSSTQRKRQLLETKTLPPVNGSGDKLQLKKFLENDKRVLRFFCYWDDRASSFGQLRKFQLHFFLADDTLQIVEEVKPNSGVLPAPVFMRRSKPPASFGDVNEIRIGSSVEVHARTFVVYDLDEFTKDYFRKTYGVTDFTPLKFEEPVDPTPQVAPITDPALFLIPKPAKKNFQKLLGNDRKVLRFAASFENGRKEDESRSFIISFYLADDTLSIYEPPQRNSGVVGGKFLERRQVQKPRSKENYRESDFFVGAIIEVFNHRFKLRNADDYAFNYMEANTEAFPSSDIDTIQKKLKSAIVNAAGQLTVEVINEAFRQFDTDSSGTISMSEFKEVIKACGFNLSEQEMITLMRRYDLDGDGSISYEEFTLVLSQP